MVRSHKLRGDATAVEDVRSVLVGRAVVRARGRRALGAAVAEARAGPHLESTEEVAVACATPRARAPAPQHTHVRPRTLHYATNARAARLPHGGRASASGKARNVGCQSPLPDKHPPPEVVAAARTISAVEECCLMDLRGGRHLHAHPPVGRQAGRTERDVLPVDAIACGIVGTEAGAHFDRQWQDWHARKRTSARHGAVLHLLLSVLRGRDRQRQNI